MRGTRAPQKVYAVKVRALKPVALDNQPIKGKGGSSASPCLHELSNLLTCLKSNNFHQEVCPNEIASFQKCLKSSKVSEDPSKSKSPETLNKLIKKYPIL